MSTKKTRDRLKSVALNGALGVAVVVVGILLYNTVVRNTAPAADPVREANPAGLVGDIIQVEVRNGCGEPGVAGQLTRYLRSRGFDVVEVGDHTAFDVEHTVVVDRVGVPETAHKVAAALGLAPERVVEEVRPEYYLDASIIIGKDYATLPAFAPE